MTRRSLILIAALHFALPPEGTRAFCGFYVAKADAKLYNSASQVVLVRDNDRTAISMANDYKGAPKDFALVVPVPVLLKREQINVGDRKLFERIDAFSAPRLVEYHDEDPCNQETMRGEAESAMGGARWMTAKKSSMARNKALGVTIEAKYTVGEYDILILGAKQSDGLETWLHENGYRIPKGASAALKPYILQKMKFFVAKVNLTEQAKAGVLHLRPIQFAYEDARFMLPIRLGMINADGPQDLLVYVLTRNGRVESTNYRTVKLPSDSEIPPYVKEEFPAFYKAMFERSVEKADHRAVFTEYFWDMAWCDPCAADPLSQDELRKLGVFWLAEDADDVPSPGTALRRFRRPGPMRGGGAAPVKVTRLHVRYDGAHFPEDLVFQETADQANFQGRYILRHPWKGSSSCQEADTYRSQLRQRQAREARTLADLTGWDLSKIHARIKLDAPDKEKTWYNGIFK